MTSERDDKPGALTRRCTTAISVWCFLRLSGVGKRVGGRVGGERVGRRVGRRVGKRVGERVANVWAIAAGGLVAGHVSLVCDTLCV